MTQERQPDSAKEKASIPSPGPKETLPDRTRSSSEASSFRRTPHAVLTPHLRAAGRSFGVKAANLPIAAISSLVATRTVVDALGPSGFAFFALVTTLPSLLPLSDLGTGAAIMGAMGRGRGDHNRELEGTVITSARALTCVGLLSALVGIVPACLGLWGTLLSSESQRSVEASVAVAFTLFGCSLPLNLGNSVLIALNRTHISLIVQTVGSVVTLGLICLSGAMHAPPTAFIASGFASQCLVGATCLLLAGRTLGIPLFGLVLRSLGPRHAATRIWHLAAPMAAVNIALAVAFATDRLVLVHVADPDAVAAYSAGARLFAPAVALAGTTGLPLWAIFARQRGTPEAPSPRDVTRLTVYFAVGGAIIGAGLILFGPAVTSWMLHGQVEVGVGLMAAFAALLLVQAAVYPSSMWLTDAAGLKFQAKRAGVMAVVNLALSIVLTRHVGASGPVIGSVIAVTTCLFLPNFRRSMSHA